MTTISVRINQDDPHAMARILFTFDNPQFVIIAPNTVTPAMWDALASGEHRVEWGDGDLRRSIETTDSRASFNVVGKEMLVTRYAELDVARPAFAEAAVLTREHALAVHRREAAKYVEDHPYNFIEPVRSQLAVWELSKVAKILYENIHMTSVCIVILRGLTARECALLYRAIGKITQGNTSIRALLTDYAARLGW